MCFYFWKTSYNYQFINSKVPRWSFMTMICWVKCKRSLVTPVCNLDISSMNLQWNNILCQQIDLTLGITPSGDVTVVTGSELVTRAGQGYRCVHVGHLHREGKPYQADVVGKWRGIRKVFMLFTKKTKKWKRLGNHISSLRCKNGIRHFLPVEKGLKKLSHLVK